MLLGSFLSAYCQKSGSKDKIKSIIVLEEKHDMLVKKQFKESETHYDNKGNILEEITYKQGKVNKHFRYQYDQDGNKIKEEKFDPSGKLIEFSEYKIENGFRVEKIVYDANRRIKSRKIYQYTTF
jgi:antitoxin component YwqK of YwqJK toxin-antitoxin module